MFLQLFLCFALIIITACLSLPPLNNKDKILILFEVPNWHRALHILGGEYYVFDCVPNIIPVMI